MVVEVLRRANLLEQPIAHDRDAVAHGHGLDLVVGDVDRGRPQALMQAGDVRARLDSELGVEVRERFVHEEDRWLADDGPSERDALPLPAGERLGLAIEQLVQAKDLARVRDASK